ncbi:MAG TPA: peptidylprolyl isomerase [Acidimicrobiia bacterium]|nr:peptidylprolyl isomerase [Acidimicrobiia bacterium]
MPDPKRERQRQNREAARQAQLEAARQAKKKQSAIRLAVVAGMAVILAVLAAFLFGRGGDKDTTAAGDTSTTTSSGPSTTTTTVDPAVLAKVQCNDTKPPDNPNRPTFTEPPPMTIDTAKKYTATMDTSCGKITIDLDPKGAPKTVNSFVFLANKKYFDGLTFHRVVKDFVIQGGDPEDTGQGGPGYEFEDELPQDGYKIGSLAMANSGPNTNGSQFFIVTGNEGAQLPSKYNRFGQVTSGIEVAQKLETFAQDPPDPNGKPSRPLYIFSVTIKEG